MNKFILGISGSIAAYKAAYLVRALVKKGKEVRVVMTPSATQFIAPITLSTLSKNNVFVDIIDQDTWNSHVDLGLWADALIVAPATASTLSKMANGLADNMLVATYLSAKCPVFIAPAMDLDMWKHQSTIQNIKKLESYGNKIIPVGHGELASGLVGDGRMAEPEEIIEFVLDSQKQSIKSPLTGKNIIITAGPTHERIDAVRFIGNRSTGKMGIALAEECASHGAKVELILGPSGRTTDDKRVKVTHVVNADQMYRAALKCYPDADIAIMAAAVADYTPLATFNHKIKKADGNWQMELKRTPDIAAELGIMKKNGQINIGFALETDNELEYATDKLQKKSFDFIVLNSLQDEGAGFSHDTNKVTIIHKDNKIRKYELKTKRDVAADIVDEIISILPHA